MQKAPQVCVEVLSCVLTHILLLLLLLHNEILQHHPEQPKSWGGVLTWQETPGRQTNMTQLSPSQGCTLAWLAGIKILPSPPGTGTKQKENVNQQLNTILRSQQSVMDMQQSI